MADDDELQVEILEGADIADRIRELAKDLDVTVEVVGDKVVVFGEDLHTFLAIIDPDHWAPKDIPEA